MLYDNVCNADNIETRREDSLYGPVGGDQKLKYNKISSNAHTSL